MRRVNDESQFTTDADRWNNSDFFNSFSSAQEYINDDNTNPDSSPVNVKLISRDNYNINRHTQWEYVVETYELLNNNSDLVYLKLAV